MVAFGIAVSLIGVRLALGAIPSRVVRTVSAGSTIACGLTTDEVAYCWRSGDDLRADSIVAVKVQGQS